MTIKANVPVEETIEEGAAREAGRVDGMAAVNETLEEQGKDAVVESLRLSRNDGNNHWEEAARAAGAHTLSAKLDWNDHTELAYYEGYKAGSYERAEEIADARYAAAVMSGPDSERSGACGVEGRVTNR